MENEEFQKIALAHFKEMYELFGKMNERFDGIDKRFDSIDERLESFEETIKHHHEDTEKTAVDLIERLDRIEAKVEVLQLETAYIRRYGNKDVHTIEQMQLDINYLVRKTSYHDDDLIHLKKAK